MSKVRNFKRIFFLILGILGLFVMYISILPIILPQPLVNETSDKQDNLDLSVLNSSGTANKIKKIARAELLAVLALTSLSISQDLFKKIHKNKLVAFGESTFTLVDFLLLHSTTGSQAP